MDNIISDFKQKADRTLENLKEDLSSVRTGRATPALLESMVVEAYGGTKMKLRELASITTEGPQNLIVAPYDPSIIPDIEKAATSTSLGFSVRTEGTRIRVILPALTQEQREKLIKLVYSKIEEKREALRNVRDEGRKRVRGMMEKKEISEDQKFRIEKELDTVSQSYMQKVQEIKEKKEAEIRQI